MLDHRLRRLLAPALTLALLAGAEGALRAKRGSPPAEPRWSEFDYFYRDIHKPFFRPARTGAGAAAYASSRPRAEPQEFLAVKPRGLARIFVVGGSVALPFAHQDGAIRLKEFLTRSFPGRSFEVIGCGMAGYDSYREALVQREILEHEPDAIVLLSGNNEYFDPVTASPALVEANRQLRRLWLFRGPLDRWRASHPRRPPSLHERLAVFEANIRLMARTAKARKVPMVLCTLPANIRDSPPLRSKPRLESPRYLDAWAAFDSGDYQESSRRFKAYISAEPADPFGRYWLAKSLDRLGLYRDARPHYLAAADLDDPGERCSASRNDIIRRVAREESMIVADLDAAFAAVAEHGLPDSRIFADGIHWHQEYYPLVSSVIARALHDAARAGHFLPPSPPRTWVWFKAERRGILHPSVSVRARDKYLEEGVYKGMTYVIQADGGLSEGALALFAVMASHDPARLDRLTDSFERSRPAFDTVWLRPYERRFALGWDDIRLHAGEAFRRRKYFRTALRIFDAVLARRPRARDLPLLLRAITFAQMGRTREAKTGLTEISPDAMRLPQFAYWGGKIAAAQSKR